MLYRYLLSISSSQCCSGLLFLIRLLPNCFTYDWKWSRYSFWIIYFFLQFSRFLLHVFWCPLLGAYMFIVIKYSWWIDPLFTMEYHTLSFFFFKSIFLYSYFCSVLVTVSVIHLFLSFSFKLFISLSQKWSSVNSI